MFKMTREARAGSEFSRPEMVSMQEHSGHAGTRARGTEDGMRHKGDTRTQGGKGGWLGDRRVGGSAYEPMVDRGSKGSI